MILALDGRQAKDKGLGMNRANEPLVVPFSSLDRGSLAVAGGKAANLGELTRAGFPVPQGFCVTTAAYAVVAGGSAIGAVLDELAGAAPGDSARLGELAARARAALLDAPVPPDIEAACVAAYRALGEGAAVAVRSSATAEDLPDASFAGQQDTYLNVIGEAAVVSAIRRCWASLWTDRAVAYRAKNGVDHSVVRLAAVVQRMVPAAVAGVLFTANPVTGRRREAVIDASPGLGEAVVSGAVNPDHFEVDVASGEIRVRRLGDKRVAIEPDGAGGTRRVERDDASNGACLSDDEIRALAELGARVEAHYGSPQDTEWALDASRALWLLQARPITTLFPLPEGAADGGLRVYMSFAVAQGVLRPMTPMGLQAWRMFTSGVAARAGFPPADPEVGLAFLAEAGNRLFFDLTPILRSALGRRLASFALARMEARTAATIQRLFDDPRLSVRPTPASRLAKAVLGAAVRTRIPLRIARNLIAPEGAPERLQRAAEEALAAGDVPAGAGPEERLAAVERLFYEGVRRMFLVAIPTLVAGLASFTLAKRALAGIASAEETETTFRALPHNPTTEMDLALWQLAASVRGDAQIRSLVRDTPAPDLAKMYLGGSLPAPLQSGLAAFLDRWGARGVAEIDLGVPRWAEDPTHILGSLANYLALDDAAVTPEAQFKKAEEEACAMVEALTRRARETGILRGASTGFGFSRMRRLAGLREAPKFHLVRLLGRARTLLLSVGADLVAAGRLDAADDIFMLDFREARAAVRGEDQRALVASRRATYARELGRRRLPRVLLSDGTEPEAALNAVSGADLRGTPASAGRVTARARVVLDPTGAKLEPGEILVAPSTDPGWTPLFLTAGGLVMEMGGAMSHGAVVAREYGIVAVVGVPRATERIETGQLITVDGGTGAIVIEEDPSH